MLLVHRIRLVPTRAQETYFIRACGVARFAYNWALAEWQHCYQRHESTSEATLRRRLNAIKHEAFPWMGEVTKCAPQQAIKNLGYAYANYFGDLRKATSGKIPWNRVRKPKFKRKGVHDSFRADNGPNSQNQHAVRIEDKCVKLPRVGWVKMRESLRFDGQIFSVIVSRRANQWYASITVKVCAPPPARFDDEIAGCDLGASMLATVYDGTSSRKIVPSKPLRSNLKRLKRFCRSLSRKRNGSSNRAKAKAKLARLYLRISDTRTDALHKLTTELVRNYRTIGIEDLNVRGMLKNRILAQSIADNGLGEFKRQLNYKAAMYGNTIVSVSRWFPSSKRCSHCGSINGTLKLAQRHWVCSDCGIEHERDENAARNLRTAASSAVAACGATNKAYAATAKPVAMKQEERRKALRNGGWIRPLLRLNDISRRIGAP